MSVFSLGWVIVFEVVWRPWVFLYTLFEGTFCHFTLSLLEG